MPQIRTKKISADEARAHRDGQIRATPKGDAVIKAAKAPPSWDDTTRTARFVMTTQQIDRYGDIVVTQGVDTTSFEQNPVALLCHDSCSWPIGSWANMEKMLKGRPIRMEGDCVLLPEGGPVPEIDQAAWMIENGGIRACSIGFMPDWDNCEMLLDDEGHWNGGLQFNLSELVECSICPVPANPGALAKSANGNMRLARSLIEDVLDNYARTPEGLLVPRAEFEKAYREIVHKRVPAGTVSADQEIPDENAAEIASIEFEVAKLVPAVPGATAGVAGAVNAKLQVADGKWKHVGELKIDDEVNFALVCAEKDGKREYGVAVSRGVAEVPLPLVKHVAGDTPFEVVALDAAGPVEAPEVAPQIIELTLDVDPAAKAELETELSGFMNSLREKISKVFRVSEKRSPEERVEPRFDPPAPPSADRIASVRNSAAAARERLASKGLV